jgi:hypothetical protein
MSTLENKTPLENKKEVAGFTCPFSEERWRI